MTELTGSKPNFTCKIAQRYAARGWALYPIWPRNGDECGCGDPACRQPGKHPIGNLAPHGKDDATTDRVTIKSWFERYPEVGIGVATGSRSGIIVIEIDNKGTRNGAETLQKLEQKLGPIGAEKTRIARSASGVRHLYFKCADGIKSSLDGLGPGIDVRGEGDAIIFPPSHGLFKWDNDNEVADLPEAWIDLLCKAKGGDASYLPPEVIQRIDELAAASLFDYEQSRKAAAKELGIRVAELDRLVASHREPSDSPEIDFLQPPTPWEEAVEGYEILRELRDTFDKHIIFQRHAAMPLACALFVLHSHAHDAATHSPILFVSSPTKRCGKTNLLSLSSMLVPKPLSAANVTAATVFRAIEHFHPSLLIDEVDTFLSGKSDLRGVLNSGHKRSLAFVLRCVGDDMIPARFSTWAPKVFAAIGRIHPTLEDRSITIELKRKLRDEHVERIPSDDNTYDVLRRKCARWARDHLDELRRAEPVIPSTLHDRARDNWRPLLAIAELCGGDWPELAREASVALSGVDDDETPAILLLGDLKALFDRENGENLSSAFIVEMLQKMEDRQWAEFNHGTPIKPNGVAKLLEPFKIRPRQIRIRSGGKRQNGYRAEQFNEAWKRYLPN